MPHPSLFLVQQLDLLSRSGFADEGDAVLDLLHQFDSGDGESEELPLPHHGPDPGMQHLNRKVKISVVRIPSREGEEATSDSLVSWGMEEENRAYS